MFRTRATAVLASLCALVGPVASAEMTEEGLRLLLETKFTEIDTDGDGKNDTFRKFDRRGGLIEKIQIDRSSNPPLRTEYRATQSPSKKSWHQYTGEWLTKQTVEYYGKGDFLLEKRIYRSSSAKAGLDKLEVWTFKDGKRITTHYRLDGGKWAQVKQESRSARLTATPSFLESFPSCYGESVDDGALADCPDVLADSDPMDFEELETSSYIDLECRDDNGYLELGNGYRIDLNSCSSEAAVDKIRAAVDRVETKSLSCLRQVNPNLAKLATDAMKEKEPLLRCAHPRNKDHPDWQQFCFGAKTINDAAYCSRSLEADVSSSAEVWEFQPSHVLLREVDPTAPAPSRAESLASTIFHETLHVGGCDHSGQEGHVDSVDAVYGCQMLCGGDTAMSAAFLSREQCRACVRGYPEGSTPKPASEGGNPSPNPKLLADCDQLPTRAQRQAIERNDAAVAQALPLYALKEDLYACEAALKARKTSPSCKNIEAQKPYIDCVAAGGSKSACVSAVLPKLEAKLATIVPPELVNIRMGQVSVSEGRIQLSLVR